jgi:hypothetical protein
MRRQFILDISVLNNVVKENHWKRISNLISIISFVSMLCRESSESAFVKVQDKEDKYVTHLVIDGMKI